MKEKSTLALSTNLQAQPDPQADPQDEHVESQSYHQHCGKGDGEPPNRQPLIKRTKHISDLLQAGRTDHISYDEEHVHITLAYLHR